jgi:hypothetical protein
VIAIDEPLIGGHLAVPVTSMNGLRPHHVAPEMLRVNDGRADAPDYFFARRYERVWQPLLRELILRRFEAQVTEQANARAIEDPICVLKEPHGSIGADVLMATLPRSRLLFLLRDGRDVVDSELDASGSGSWATDYLKGYAPSDDDRLGHLRERAHAWLLGTLVTERAFERHPPELRRLVRYEDLLEDGEGQLAALDAWLGLDLGHDRIRAAVRDAEFARLPVEQRGRGKFARAAQPGLWRENLSAEEQAVLEELIGARLRELGYS